MFGVDHRATVLQIEQVYSHQLYCQLSTQYSQSYSHEVIIITYNKGYNNVLSISHMFSPLSWGSWRVKKTHPKPLDLLDALGSFST